MRFTYGKEGDNLKIVLGIVADFASGGRLFSVEIESAGELYHDEDL